MRNLVSAIAIALLALLTACVTTTEEMAARRGIELADLTWMEAEEILTPDAVVVIPLGAAAKEHGPHLRLDNDFQIAEYLKRRVLEVSEIVVAPTITYHFYPAFLEYPGSTHLRFETSRDVVVDIVSSLAAYGPKRFYVLNTGVSTLRPLAAAATVLAQQEIVLHYTNILEVAGEAVESVREQEAGTHADEIETSVMLYITPDRVNMDKARREISPREGRGGLTRIKGQPGTYSESGIWGDATLADVRKGRVIVEAIAEGLLRDIKELRHTPVE